MDFNNPAAGIIPFVKCNDTTFYLLGQEKSNYTWSGFIGNYKVGEDFSIYNTAIREFNEETSNIFIDYLPTITKLVHKTKPVVVKKNTKNIYIYFIELPVSFFNNNTTYKFRKNKKEFLKFKELREYTEKIKLGWFTKECILEHHDVLGSLKKIISNNK